MSWKNRGAFGGSLSTEPWPRHAVVTPPHPTNEDVHYGAVLSCL